MKTGNAKRMLLFVMTLLSSVAPACIAEDNAWTGTWRLNHEKSHLGGPTFLLTISSVGEYELTAGSNHFKFYCDAKYRVVVGQRTFACLKATGTSMEVVERQGGVAVLSVHRELSSDGKLLTQTTTRLDGSTVRAQEKRTFVRFSKSGGLAGSWLDVNGLDRQPQVMMTAVNAGTIHLSFPLENQHSDARLDGSESLIHGTYSGIRATLSVKSEAARRLRTVEKLNGAVVNHGVLILSSDGRSITQQTWKPSAPAVKTILVYEK